MEKPKEDKLLTFKFRQSLVRKIRTIQKIKGIATTDKTDSIRNVLNLYIEQNQYILQDQDVRGKDSNNS